MMKMIWSVYIIADIKKASITLAFSLYFLGNLLYIHSVADFPALALL